MIEEEVREALKEAIKKTGSIANLSRTSGIAYSVLNRYINNRSDVGAITLKTLKKIFPELQLSFFYDSLGTIPLPNDPVIFSIVTLVNLLKPEERQKVFMLIVSNFEKEINTNLHKVLPNVDIKAIKS